jgi:hypothetical protein
METGHEVTTTNMPRLFPVIYSKTRKLFFIIIFQTITVFNYNMGN